MKREVETDCQYRCPKCWGKNIEWTGHVDTEDGELQEGECTDCETLITENYILTYLHTTHEVEAEETETCNECGRSVKAGSGLFINRVPSLDSIEERKAMGKPFPTGGYVCAECEAEIIH